MVTPRNTQAGLTEKSDEKGLWLNSVDALVLFYQAVISAVIATGNLPMDFKIDLIEDHAIIFFVLLFLLWAVKRIKNPVVQFVKDFYPLIAMLFFYKEIGLLVHQYFDWTLDEAL
ncbi:MAG TPA: hypothetical protein VN963_03880, partial [bacterium]|nr:hypothetical protein [bacterium]